MRQGTRQVGTHRQRTRALLTGTAFLLCWLTCVVEQGAGQGGQRGVLSFDRLREEMVKRDIVGGGIKNRRVIEAMLYVPRHEFVPADLRRVAYMDMALPIGHGQTISPPYVVAFMTEQIDPQPEDKVLEIGTGSGYQAAILSVLVKEVYTIEIVAPLAQKAAATLKRLGYKNVFVKAGDGYLGWPEHAPFDKIIVTCSPEDIPRPLVEQLKEGGRMVIPVGERYQQILYLLRKQDGQLVKEALQPTLFVPMTGQAEGERSTLPDPKNPCLVNGDFEMAFDEIAAPPGWYYCKEFEILKDGTAPSGEAYIAFRNHEPGRPARALQGFAVDGRFVKEMELSFWVRGENIRPGRSSQESAGIVITFFDENRAPAGQKVIGPFLGSFPWRQEKHRILVPPGAREAILAIGMTGAVGTFSLDNFELRVVSGQRR